MAAQERAGEIATVFYKMGNSKILSVADRTTDAEQV